MKRNIVKLILSCLMVTTLMLASCTSATTEEEQVPLPAPEDVTAVEEVVAEENEDEETQPILDFHQLTTNIHKDEDPFLMQDSDNVYWIVWCSDRSGNGDIWYSKSPDGMIWTEPVQLISDTFDDWYPSLIQDFNGTYWLAWMSWRSGNYDAWYANSTDGKNWSEPVQLTTDESVDWAPSLSKDSSGAYWVIWASERSGNKDIWCTSSKDGIKWSTTIQITASPAEDDCPWLLQDANGTYWAVWHSNRNGNYDIIYSNSTDGASWSEPVALISDNSTDMYPFLLQDCAGTYWLTWTSDRSDVYGDIWYFVSEDGIEWSAPIQVTKASSRDYTSRLIEDTSGIIWITYVSDRSGNLDIWYTRLAKPEG